MKKNIQILFLFIMSIYSPHGLSKEVAIAMNNFCPYHCLDSDGNWDKNQPGYVYEIYNEIYTKAGYIFKPVQNSFHRGMVNAGTGIVDAISGPIKITSKKELAQKLKTNIYSGAVYNKLIYSTEPISLYQSSCFFGKANMDWSYQGTNSLETLQLGSIKDFAYGETLEKYIESNKENKEKIHLMYGSNIAERIFMMLIKDRVEIILLDLNVGLYRIKKSNDKSVKLLGCLEEGKRHLYVGFSPVKLQKSIELLRVFDTGIQQMRKSGKLKIIFEKYGLKDWNEAN